jgi:hypothetical protein
MHVKLAARWEDTFVFNVADFHLSLYEGGSCGVATPPAQWTGNTTKLNTKTVESKKERSTNVYYESDQQNAIVYVNLLFLVGSACFGRCFRPSSVALYCIYSFW